MTKDWYKNWFGNEYLTVYAHRDEEEAHELIQLINKKIPLRLNSKILDLCCGQGRHALLLASQGYTVIGVDLSRTLLQIAKYKRNYYQKAHFIQADMRFLPANHSFDLLLNLFTSFGYFARDEENEAVFRQFCRVLKPGGYFVFDFLNTKHVIENLVPNHKEEIGNVTVELQRSIENLRINKKISLLRNGNRSVFYESVKMYDPTQIKKMMKNSGLTIENIYGDYSGIEFQQNSPRLIIIGRNSLI
jgi:ubiquinone/menaquinone biosynthesis C-methylase UbiE